MGEGCAGYLRSDMLDVNEVRGVAWGNGGWLDTEQGCDNVCAGDPVKTSLRTILAESHVAPIAIAILMAQAIVEIFVGLATPIRLMLVNPTVFFILWISERELPSTSILGDRADLFLLIDSIPNLFYSLAFAVAAWVLSRLIYGRGPIESLRYVGSQFSRRMNASSNEGGAQR
jgi:hypothetical protein